MLVNCQILEMCPNLSKILNCRLLKSGLDKVFTLLFRRETKVPEMMLHQVLPTSDENGSQKMVETFMAGKMMLTDAMKGK